MAATAHLQKQILEALTFAKRFEAADWLLHAQPAPTGTPKTDVTITYAFRESYYYKARIPHAKGATFVESSAKREVYDFDIATEYSPGEASTLEKAQVVGLHRLIESIKEWAKRIDFELSAIPLARDVAAQQARIDDLAAQLGLTAELADDAFTSEEADRLKARLTDLEGQLTAEIEARQQDAKETQSQLAALHAEIENLKQAADSLGKRGWLRKFAGALSKVGEPVVQKLLTAGALEGFHRLLPPGS